MLKELGIGSFLAAVGLKSGDLFRAALTQGEGIRWKSMSVVITLAPLLALAATAHRWFRIAFVPLLGVLAGSTTDPPALAFANGLPDSELPAINGATVYPLARILRLLCALATA